MFDNLGLMQTDVRKWKVKVPSWILATGLSRLWFFSMCSSIVFERVQVAGVCQGQKKKEFWAVENKRKNWPITLGELEAALNTPQHDCLAKGLWREEGIWDSYTVSSMSSILHLSNCLNTFSIAICAWMFPMWFLMWFLIISLLQLVENVEIGCKVKTPGA